MNKVAVTAGNLRSYVVSKIYDLVDDHGRVTVSLSTTITKKTALGTSSTLATVYTKVEAKDIAIKEKDVIELDMNDFVQRESTGTYEDKDESSPTFGQMLPSRSNWLYLKGEAE